MFTGIIQAVGTVISFEKGTLVVDPGSLNVDHLELGESIAVDGVCRTLFDSNEGLSFELSPETINRSAFASIQTGSKVNLERAMVATDRFGGHIVQGHVDGVGSVISITPSGNSTIFRFRIPSAQYVIEKGSITLNGVSLTVVEPEGNEFNVWIIPHTLANTNLGLLSSGSLVNVEYDVIAKYVEKMTKPHFG